MTPPVPDAPPIPAAQKWAITLTVMVVAFMQILDTSVTNVILPHLQGSMSAGLNSGATPGLRPSSAPRCHRRSRRAESGSFS